MPPDFSTLDVSVSGPVCHVQLCRPDALNAISIAMMRELREAAAWCDENASIRAVVISGAGRVFSAGADVDESVELLDHLQNQDPMSVRPLADAQLGWETIRSIEDMGAVTVAAAHGAVIGGAMSILAACDLRVLGDDTRAVLPETELGIPLAWGGISLLIRDLGPSLTKRLLLTGEPLSPSEALARGFATAVVSGEEVVSTAMAMATSIAAKPAFATTVVKQRINKIARFATLADDVIGDAEDYLAALRDPEALHALHRYMKSFRKTSDTEDPQE